MRDTPKVDTYFSAPGLHTLQFAGLAEPASSKVHKFTKLQQHVALECSELVTLEMQRRKGYNQPRKNKKQTTCLFKQIAPFLVMQQRFWIAISTSCSNPAIAARIRTSSSGLEQEASAKVVKSRLVACRFNSTSAKNSSSVTEPWNGRLTQSLPGENAKFMTGQPTRPRNSRPYEGLYWSLVSLNKA